MKNSSGFELTFTNTGKSNIYFYVSNYFDIKVFNNHLNDASGIIRNQVHCTGYYRLDDYTSTNEFSIDSLYRINALGLDKGRFASDSKEVDSAKFADEHKPDGLYYEMTLKEYYERIIGDLTTLRPGQYRTFFVPVDCIASYESFSKIEDTYELYWEHTPNPDFKDLPEYIQGFKKHTRRTRSNKVEFVVL